MYGLTLEQVRVVRAVGACMTCSTSVSGFDSGIFAVDHCHDSGVGRGVPCQACNFLLGNARDDVEVLWGAVKYLMKDHSAEPWNQGRSRAGVAAERKDQRLSAHLARAENTLAKAERRVKELESVLSEVSDDAAVAACRRARDAVPWRSSSAGSSGSPPLGDSRVTAGARRSAWTEWTGSAPCPVQSLHEALHKSGAAQRRSAAGKYWDGVGLRPVPPDTAGDSATPPYGSAPEHDREPSSPETARRPAEPAASLMAPPQDPLKREIPAQNGSELGFHQSPLSDSNRRPTHYKCVALAGLS